MALIQCPECNGEVSSKADKCPHCGLPNKYLEQSSGHSDSKIVVSQIASPDIEADFEEYKRVLWSRETIDGRLERFLRSVAANRINIWKQGANSGRLEHQILYGECLYLGIAVVEDRPEAVKLFRSAAQQNDPVGICLVGACYLSGNGITKDQAEGIKWLERAADQHVSYAMFHLALANYKWDKAKCLSLLLAAGDHGNLEALWHAARLLRGGLGASKNPEKAFQCFLRAAKSGHAMAQVSTGNCLMSGRGVGRDKNEAVNWYRESANQGEELGQYSLAECYENGDGVREDLSKARHWYAKAAAQGMEDAVEKLNEI